METAELILDEKQLKTFSPADAEIARLAEEYLPLKINGIDDKEGFIKVHEARMIVKGYRVDVEKKRKELKADALEYGRKVDAEAKRITAMLTPIEDHLSVEEQKIKDEKERIARAEEEARQAKLNKRLEQLTAAECLLNPATVEAMDDTEFEAMLADAVTAKAQRDADRKAFERRLATEREAIERQRIEAEKIEAEARAEAEAERQRIESEQAEERRKLAAEREKIEAERRAIELEKAKAEAAENARREEAERIKREAEEAEQRAKAEQAERERLEALRPEVEKIQTFANDLVLLKLPEGLSESSAKAIRLIRNRAAEEIRQVAESL